MSNVKQYILTLKPRRGVDGVQALRKVLKLIGRYGLRCVTAKQIDKVSAKESKP